MSELTGIATTGLFEAGKAFVTIHNKNKDELEQSRVFVDIEQITGLNAKAKDFYPNQVKKIYRCDEDQNASRNERSNCLFLKITNDTDKIIRNALVSIHTVHNYQGENRILHVHINQIIKGEWVMVLLPATFTSFPAGAGMACMSGLSGIKHVDAIEEIRYVEVEYKSDKNEDLKVEVAFNGRTKWFVNDSVVKAFDNAGRYTYGV